MADQSKIEWCDMTWNPVWGCKFKCEYCYARSTSRRFGANLGAPDFNVPTWMQRNYDKNFPKSARRVFINSMSDPSFWKTEWTSKIMMKIQMHRYIDFILLTKDPKIYFNAYPENVICGITAVNAKEILNAISTAKKYNYPGRRYLLNIEPISEPVTFTDEINELFDWIIIGAETGLRKNKVIPSANWLYGKISTPLFLKDNLRPYMSGKIIDHFKQFPVKKLDA